MEVRGGGPVGCCEAGDAEPPFSAASGRTRWLPHEEHEGPRWRSSAHRATSGCGTGRRRAQARRTRGSRRGSPPSRRLRPGPEGDEPSRWASRCAPAAGSSSASRQRSTPWALRRSAFSAAFARRRSFLAAARASRAARSSGVSSAAGRVSRFFLRLAGAPGPCCAPWPSTSSQPESTSSRSSSSSSSSSSHPASRSSSWSFSPSGAPTGALEHGRAGRPYFPAIRAMSSATSSIMSSCPPTVLRLPISTRMSRDETPYRSPARLAKSRNDE